jgi:hypothetical protein
MAIQEQARTFWNGRSSREKGLLALAGIGLAVFIIWPMMISPIQVAFQNQTKALKEISTTYSVAPDILARYTKLGNRRKELEQFYSGVDLSADPLSYLERLLRDTAKASGTYNVTPREGVQLGGKYAHKVFLVNFQTTSMDNLSAFLRELTSGKQPMLISQITLDKRLSAESLNVQLEVSGFEAINSSK